MNLEILGLKKALGAPSDAEVKAISLRRPDEPAALAPRVARLLGVLEIEHEVRVELTRIAERRPAPPAPKTLQDRVQAARIALRRARTREDLGRLELHREKLRVLKRELEAG